LLLFFTLIPYACKEDWNDHYDKDPSLPGQDLYEMIKKEADLSVFTQMIEIAGYDSVLRSTQTFTIWAPVNDALKEVDLTDKDAVRLIVRNHIARFNNPSSTSHLKLIRMVNGKIHYFSNQGGVYFGGIRLLTHDQLAKNGILHTVDAQIPYLHNIYEYINSQAHTSKMSAFISSFMEERFDEELSIPIDVDEEGRTVYDTVKTWYNRLFETPYIGLGNINAEDSVFTMLIPDNNAWDAAYKRISPYFKVYNESTAKADSISNLQTSLAIVSDLIFRNRIENPSTYDTLITTSRSVIHDVNEFFANSFRTEASNGLMYQTGMLMYNNVETWNKMITVECEDQEGRVTAPNTSVYTRLAPDNSTITGISQGRYIEVQPTSTSAQPAVTFEVPGVLSGKYNVHVDFIPAAIQGESYSNDSTKLMFNLEYIKSDGSTGSQPATSAEFVTSGTKKVRLTVFREYEFPVSNLYDNLWYMDEANANQDIVTTTKFMIRTDVKPAEVNNNIYTRRFRVDRIIFEPVKN